MKERETSPQARREQLDVENKRVLFDMQMLKREIKQLERSRHPKLTEAQNTEITRLIEEREGDIIELEEKRTKILEELEELNKSLAVNPDKE